MLLVLLRAYLIGLCKRVRCATGVKVLLAGEQQAAVTVAVEGLMDGKPLPDLESFLTFDPKVGVLHVWQVAQLVMKAIC